MDKTLRRERKKGMAHLDTISSGRLPSKADVLPTYEIQLDFESPLHELPDNGVTALVRMLLRGLDTAPAKKGKEA